MKKKSQCGLSYSCHTLILVSDITTVANIDVKIGSILDYYRYG